MLQFLKVHAEFLEWLISTVIIGIPLWIFQMRWNVVSEKRLIHREDDAEKRLIQREQEELERRTWQELGAALLKLHYLVGTLRSGQAFIQTNNDQMDATTRAFMSELTTQMHRNMYAYFQEYTGAATLLSVLPQDQLKSSVQTAMLKFGWANHAEFSQIKDEDINEFLTLIKAVNEKARI